MNFTFPLVRGIVIPVNPVLPSGDLVFKPGAYALSYAFNQSPQQKTLNLSIFISDILGREVRNIKSYVITEQGFDLGESQNQAELDAWQVESDILAAEYESLQSQVNVLKEQEDALIIESVTESFDWSKLQEATQKRASKEGELSSKAVEIFDHNNTKPQRIPIMRNSYSDIIQFFNSDGEITEQGLEWAKNFPFLGKTIGYYITQ